MSGSPDDGVQPVAMNPKNFVRINLIFLTTFLLVCLGWAKTGASAAIVGSQAVPGWGSPVVGPVIRLFERPLGPYLSGHRGIDYPAAQDEPIIAPAAGIVSFVGPVFDRVVVVITHPNGVKSEVEPICPSVVPGEPVVRGSVLGVFCVPDTPYAMHCDGVPCLHFSIRKDGEYFAPQVLIGGLSPTRLLNW